jgi:hypothetical protein
LSPLPKARTSQTASSHSSGADRGALATYDPAMTVSWNWEIIDERIAMDMSLFTEADIPDVGPRHPDAEHWIWHYFANTVVRARFDGAPDRYAALMIRRITISFEEYELARTRTSEFLDRRAAGGQPIREYLSALHHWEQVVAAVWQCSEAMMKWTGQQMFKGGDGSAAERMHHLYNRSKHTDKAVRSGQMPPKGQVAMWLTNEGLRTTEQAMEWAELADALDELGKTASILQDPMTAFSSLPDSDPSE